MTVEELNVRISADATNFKIELAAANNAMKLFREDAVNAGNEITAAFKGLIDTAFEAASKVSEVPSVGSVSFRYDPDKPAGSRDTSWQNGAITTLSPSLINSSPAEPGIYSRTANVLDLDKSETVIGAVSAPEQPSQPVNITTTVELDGDKVGQSVNRFNMRRNKITNGLYQ